jgi:ribonuclease T1
MRIAGFWVLAIALCLGSAPDRLQARDDGPGPGAVIAVADLPTEARDTLELIRQGGPFPYARDGAVFGNREGLLPRAPRGSYREYTVKTPGRRDRGARRIIGSNRGEFYYTADHYRSFRRILQ